MPANLLLLASTLEPCGYTVIAADTIKRATMYISKVIPNLIISDVHLRNESGYDFLRRVKANPLLRAIPFIFLSSTATAKRDQTRAFGLGADRFLVRPIEPAALLSAIEGVLGERAGGDEGPSLGRSPGTGPSGDEPPSTLSMRCPDGLDLDRR
jgi:two-component system cell cycle response regulator